MHNNHQSDRLSWGDTVFLNLEREGMPLNVAAVCVFEGQVSFDDCVQFVASKLPLIPRYLKRVVPEPFGLGLPSWEYDREFDLRNHVREVTLKNGTDAELKAVAAKLFGEVMDRRHPLWDMTFVRGLKGNHTGLIMRLHHCLADGIAGVGLMNVIFDASAEAPRLPRKKLRVRAPAVSRDPLSSLASGFLDSYSDFVKRVLSGYADLLSIVERTAVTNGNGTANGMANGKSVTEELAQLLPEMTATTERLRFNVVYRGPQKFAWTELPLDQIKAIKEACGASVNDVLLTLVTSTIRRYTELHGDAVKDRLLRLMVPVNLRGNDNAQNLGNRISIIPVTVPLDIRNPLKLLAEVHRRTEFLKKSHAAELVSLAGGLIGIFPSAMQAFVGPAMSKLPITPFNMVCTNVPGPQYPLYLIGHKLLRWYPYVPVGGEMAVNCAILSYDGKVFFGFSGDVHAAPDLGRMEKFVKESFAELRSALRAPRKNAARAKKTAAKKSATEKPARAAAKVGVPVDGAASSSKETVSVPTQNAEEPVRADAVA